MSLDIPLPKQIFGHPWLLFGNDKMSKSKGNLLYADDLVKEYGVDAVRYYVLHEIPYANDGNLTDELLIERINSDLANILGNLVNRTIAMGNKYFNGTVRNVSCTQPIDGDLILKINELDNKIEKKMDTLEVGAAIEEIFELLRRSNKYIDETMPWILAKDDASKDRLETVLYNLLESIRVSANLIRPFLPETADKILEQIGNDNDLLFFNNDSDNVFKLGEATPLFKRIDKKNV